MRIRWQVSMARLNLELKVQSKVMPLMLTHAPAILLSRAAKFVSRTSLPPVNSFRSSPAL
ncbi:hypothetical protein AGR7B_pAt0009 [Agrobacterium deltaense RV3]|nr:hypothetical protein AGR7B_pAt0009 [Agrobacterium deltaense RV3]